MSTKLQYRVKPHATFGPMHEHKEGAIVELTAEEAQGFLDILELVGGEDAPLPSDAPLQNEADMKVPGELKLDPDAIRLQDGSFSDLPTEPPDQPAPAKPKTARKGKAES